ncbi:glycosyltransferase family 2 protein [Intrasporangium sp. DVR]|uniref:glycosyltransferase family 2 protein n=1 Tax=Intrasporangium sp. DVR TaxID=3127867 RepID=UPI0033412B50
MRLSVIIPTYNVAPYVGRSIRSVLAQSGDDTEIIVVDDGSSDGTAALCTELLESAPSIPSRLITQRHAGVSAARNAGARAATGDYLLFLDGDDYVSPQLVSQLRGVLQTESPDIVCWGFDTVTPDTMVIGHYFEHFRPPTERPLGGLALTRHLVRGDFSIWMGSAAFRRSFLSRYTINFTEGCRSGEDREFIYKAACRSEVTVFIPQTLSFYVARPGSMTRSGDIRQFDSVQAHIRASHYLAAASQNEESNNLAESILINNAVGGYFRHLENCMRYGEHANMKDLLLEIDRRYPGLNQCMRRIMKRRVQRSTKPALGTALFLLSPSLFWRALVMRRRSAGEVRAL